MGGGGAMRTAAKIAGIGVSRSGLRGSAAALPTEQSVRNASSQQSSIVGGPTHVIQAFHLFSSSREAQDVVASLVSDRNVWNAVEENPALTSFLQSQHTVADFGVVETDEEVQKLSSCASVVAETPEKKEVTTESHAGNPFFDFKGFQQNVKLKVTELGSRVSSYLQNIFPTPDTPKDKPSSDADGNTKASFMDSKTIMGETFIGLALLVIMVIVGKRIA